MVKNSDQNIFITDWHTEDVPDEDDDASSGSSSDKKQNLYTDKFLIRGFGLDEEGKSVAIDIKGFQPYFFVKVPDTWNNNLVSIFVEALKNKVWAKFRENLVSWKLIRAKPFYYFTGNNKFKFIKMIFSSYSGSRKFEYVLREKVKIMGLNKSKPYLYERYESNIPPLLRFIHGNNLNATGWVHLKKGTYDKQYINETTCKSHLSAHYRGIQKLDRDQIPGVNYVAFDIEADSSHGDFPVAKKNYQKLARDIITTYNSVCETNKKAKIRGVNMRNYIHKWLKLAFNSDYNNNNIRPVKTENNEKPTREVIESTAQMIMEIIDHENQEDDEVDELLQTFEFNLPTLDEDTEIDYYSLAEQIQKECKRLKRTNNVRFKENPLRVVKFMLALAFDNYYDNHDINVVYTHQNKKPKPETLRCLIPTINELCEKCFNLVQKEKKFGRKKLKPGETKISQDTYVEKLQEILDRYLPKLEGDKVIQIGTVYKRYGEADCYLKHIICLDTCSEITNDTMIGHEHKDVFIANKDLVKELVAAKTTANPDLDKDELKKQLEAQLKDPKQRNVLNLEALEYRRLKQLGTDKAEVIVECYETEAEVLCAWTKLIQRTDPDIISGYNINGFDFKYMYERAEVLGVVHEFSQLGRIKHVEQELVEQKLSSSGLGDNLLYYIAMFGRAVVDLYKVAQSSFRLDSYKLDFVCKKYLNKSKNDVPPSEIFIKQKGDADDRRDIAEYCLIDCVLCIRLIDKLEIITNNIGMSQVCSVTFSMLFLRGQGIKLLSFVSKICREKGYLIPVLERDDGEGGDSYEGAIVLNAYSDVYFEPVVVADFNSLYPSCMISENLSHDSFVGFKVVPKGSSTDFRGQLLNPDNIYEKNLLEGKYEGWDYCDVIYDIYDFVPVAKGRKKLKKIVKAHKICRYAQPPNEEKSIVPTILKELLAARKQTRKEQKKFPKGSFKWNVKEGLQLAYKVTANSLYGQIGARTSAIFLQDIAACTTATGRKLIIFSKNFCEKNYKGCITVYGDTDSVFLKFKTTDRYGNPLYGLDAVYKSIELCTEASIAISRQLKKPHNLEFEKAILPFILVSKKRYHGHYYTIYGSPDYYPNSMGIVLKRRDNAKIVKHVFGGMTDIIMKEHSVEKAVAFIIKECTRMLNGEFGMDMFIITKTLRSYYKQPDSIAHNVLAQRIGKRDPGNKPRGNDRIAYAYIRVANEDCLQGDRIETPEFIKENNLKLDYRFYLERQIMKPVSQILDLMIDNSTQIFEKLIMDYDNRLTGVQKIEKGKFKCIKFVKMNAVTHTQLKARIKSVARKLEEQKDMHNKDEYYETDSDDDIYNKEYDEYDSDEEKIR